MKRILGLLTALALSTAQALAAPGPYPFAPPITSPITQQAYNSTGSQPLNVSCASTSFSACPSGSIVGIVAQGMGNVAVQVNGTFTATLQIESSLDCVNFTALPLAPQGSTSSTSTLSGAGLWTGAITSVYCVQVRVTSYTSGTANVTISVAGSGGSVTSAGGSSVPTGTAGSPNAAVVTVQGITNGTAVNDNCGNCALPFPGTADNQSTASAQALGVDQYNGTGYDRWQGSLGAGFVSSLCAPSAAITASGNTVIKGSPGFICGYANLDNASSQTITVKCYNNATTNTGNLLLPAASFGLSQFVMAPYPLKASAGITCNLSGAAAGLGIVVYYY